jgi:hypothetical protein
MDCSIKARTLNRAWQQKLNSNTKASYIFFSLPYKNYYLTAINNYCKFKFLLPLATPLFLPSYFLFLKTQTMNQLKFYGKLLCAATVFFIASCGNSEDKTTTETTATDSSTMAPADAAPVNTIVTTPEITMVVRHKVPDYDKWLTSFEAHDSMKLANGLHNYVVGRSMSDPNTLLVATKADDLDKAKAFGKSADLKAAMKKTGVMGTPIIQFVRNVYQDTGDINTDIRMMSILTVKDWDAWKTSIESHRDVTKAAGLVDRVNA